MDKYQKIEKLFKYLLLIAGILVVGFSICIAILPKEHYPTMGYVILAIALTAVFALIIFWQLFPFDSTEELDKAAGLNTEKHQESPAFQIYAHLYLYFGVAIIVALLALRIFLW